MKRIKKSIFALSVVASVVGTSIVASATTKYPSTNDEWSYGTKKIAGTKYTYSDYLNYNGVNWYTASVTDKNNNLKSRDKKTDGVTHAYAFTLKKSGNQVYYNYN